MTPTHTHTNTHTADVSTVFVTHHLTIQHLSFVSLWMLIWQYGGFPHLHIDWHLIIFFSTFTSLHLLLTLSQRLLALPLELLVQLVSSVAFGSMPNIIQFFSDIFPPFSRCSSCLLLVQFCFHCVTRYSPSGLSVSKPCLGSVELPELMILTRSLLFIRLYLISTLLTNYKSRLEIITAFFSNAAHTKWCLSYWVSVECIDIFCVSEWLLIVFLFCFFKGKWNIASQRCFSAINTGHLSQKASVVQQEFLFTFHHL